MIKDDGNIFIEFNPYAYKINIAHPQIKPLYERYCHAVGCPLHYPLSDAQRFDFERRVMKLIEPKGERQL